MQGKDMADLKCDLEFSYDFGSIANFDKFFEAFGKEINDSLTIKLEGKGRVYTAVDSRKISHLKITNYGEIIFQDFFFQMWKCNNISKLKCSLG